jgi:hypothetical protein
MAVTDIDWGTVTLTNGETEVVGVGTSFLADEIRDGDTFVFVDGADGFQSPIVESVQSNTELTLRQPWSGPTLTAATYTLRYQWDSSRVSAMSRRLIMLLDNGNLTAFSQLTGPGVAVFTGPHSMEVRPFSDFVNGVAFNVQVDTLADRAAYDGQTQGFTVLVSDVGDGRSAVFTKNSNTSADWSDAAYITGPSITLAVTEVDEVPYGTPPDVTLTPISGGYNLAFDIPRGMIIEPGTTTTLPANQDAAVNFVPITGGYRMDLSLPRGPAGDINGVTPFWQSRITNDATRAAARLGLGIYDDISPPSFDLVLTEKTAILPEWFTRASTGTYFDSAGVLRTAAINEIRIDHDPATGIAAALIEGAATNLFLHSNDASQSAWAKLGATVTASGNALTPNRVTATATTFPRIQQSPVVTAQTYAMSAIVRAGNVNFYHGTIERAGQTAIRFYGNLVTGQTSQTADASVIAHRLTRLTDGSWLVAIVWTATGASSVNAFIGPSGSLGSAIAVVGDYIDVGNLQFEAGTTATSRIPTGAASATRAVDRFTIVNGWSAPWVNPSAGTWLVEAMSSEPSNKLVRIIERTSGNNGVIIELSETNAVRSYLLGSSTASIILSGSANFGRNTFARICAAYSSNQLALTANGLSVQTAVAGAMGVAGDIYFGYTPLGSGASLNGHIRRITYWPRRLTNAELQAISS